MKFAFAVVCACVGITQAQNFTFLPDAPPEVGVPGPRPANARIVGLDRAGIDAALRAAPPQRLDASLDSYGLSIELPGPDGDLVPCFVAVSSMMEPQLAEKFPQFRSFVVQSADGSASGRLEVTPRAVTAMLRTQSGTWMIDAWQSADPLYAVAYWLSDLQGGGDWVCETTGAPAADAEEGSGAYSPRAAVTLRTVRLAMACNGEYGLYQSQIQGHAPNVADPLAAIFTVVGRTNVVYENDLAVHFNLVANNDQIIFTDPDTDPYSTDCSGGGGTDCSGSLLGVNITTLANRIGNANFDVGHVLTRIYGGVAYLRAVCSNSKAGGVSGIPRGGDVDPLSALVVIHELGHQFGANHTFSGTRGRCLGNVNLSTAWEAGSGSSPMAYAGGCPVGDAPPTDNVRQFADPFFHHGSLTEMRNFLGTAACPVQSATSNETPAIVNVTGDTAIPPETPFMLAALAQDVNGDTLTYSWEQIDAGVARPLTGDGATDNGSGALFRAFPPASGGARTFPQLADVRSGVPTPGERLPTVTGVTRKFAVLVRDNRAGAGGIVISPQVLVSIAAGTTPFAVVSPGGDGLLPGSATQVTWTVGGTDAAPISCSSVVIRLSVDDGVTFPYTLGTFPNTGAAMVMLPPVETATARVKVDPASKIFFAMSRVFSMQYPCIADVNVDGSVDGSDVEAFFNLWDEGGPAGDLNGDGGVDGGDVEFFFRHWENGC